MDTFDLKRIKSFLKKEPDCNVVIISNNRMSADLYWNRIQSHLGIKKNPFIITNHPYSLDGVPIHGALVLKIGRWWENKNAIDFMKCSPLAKMSLPITFIPPYEGGENV